MAGLPRVVIVTRPTPYEELLARHATRLQADFFLRQRGQSLDAAEALHHQVRHQSARYEISFDGQHANHSSSGVIVTTGTGATGWARSIALERRKAIDLPGPSDCELAFFVREAFPSHTTSTELTEGRIAEGEMLTLTSRKEDGVVFGDGIESDALRFGWGQRLRLQRDPQRLMLVVQEGRDSGYR